MAELQTNLSNINFMSKSRFESLESIDDSQLYAVEFPFTDGDLVHTNFDETINGIKTFNDEIYAPNQVDYSHVTNCLTEIPQDIKLELKEVETEWSQPTLTNNGSIGGSSFGCRQSHFFVDDNDGANPRPQEAWRLFSGEYNGNDEWQINDVSLTSTYSALWYNPRPMKIVALKIQNGQGQFSPAVVVLQGSNDNSTWITLGTSNNDVVDASTWDATITSQGWYQYYRIVCTPRDTTSMMIARLHITAFEKINTLTLKAGSKVYVPMGTEPTDEIIGTKESPLYAWAYTTTAGDTPYYVYTTSESPVVGDKVYSDPTNMNNSQNVLSVNEDGTITFGSEFFNYVGTRNSANDTTYTENVYKTRNVFDEVVIEEDISRNVSSSSNYNSVITYNVTSKNIGYDNIANVTYGTTAPTNSGTFYNSNSNTIRYYTNGNIGSNVYSLPIAIVSVEGASGFKSINQIFNGFGYMGNTTFVLPGVKYLAPNGRNPGGTFNNIPFEQKTILFKTLGDNTWFNLITNENAWYSNYECYIQSETPIVTTNAYWFDNEDNILYRYNTETNSWEQKIGVLIGQTFIENNQITSFTPRQVFKIADLTGDNIFTGTVTFTEPIQGTAYRALWGDLAEYYESDKEYPRGTLVQFGGTKEITIASDNVNAVITSEPGFILNTQQSFNAENSQAIALVGKVPVRAIGKVKKFDYLTLSDTPGVATVWSAKELPNACVIARALENKNTEGEGLVFCTVKFEL